MQKAHYDAANTTRKQHTSKHIQLHTPAPNTQAKVYKSYYLKPLGRFTLALFFVALAIILACIAPDAAEGSVFFILLAIGILASKQIKVILKV